MSEIAIKVENLKKQYRLGVIGGGTLSADLQSWWARKRGKEDPNTIIGTDQTRMGEVFFALDDVSLEVKKGEAVGIIGSNGAGKSTLLKLLSRVTAPTEGRIGINGRVASMLEVGTGFHPELTGRENIYMNGAILGMTKAEIDAKLEDIIDFSECRQFIDTPVKRYSSGMYVKLAFAVAAHLDAEIMIMDEVLAVGDVKFQQKCLGKMGDAANNEGRTVLYVSHNMTTVRQLCTRCVVLAHGKVIYDGEVEEAINRYIDTDKGNMTTFYDFTDVKRPSLDHGVNLFLYNFEFIDKEEAVFNTNEPMKFRIQFMAKYSDVENLGIYFTVQCLDSTIVGTTQSKCFGDAKKGVMHSCEFMMDISNLVAGKYQFHLDIFQRNDFGTMRSVDHPWQKIYFEVKENDTSNSIEWKRRYYGSVRLNPLEIMKSDSGN